MVTLISDAQFFVIGEDMMERLIRPGHRFECLEEDALRLVENRLAHYPEPGEVAPHIDTTSMLEELPKARPINRKAALAISEMYIGGGRYHLPDGTSILGKERAIEYLRTLEGYE